MSCQYSLLLLFFCGFATLTVSKTCGKLLLEGTSCTMKLKIKNNEKPDEVKWLHVTSKILILRWKKGKIKTMAKGVSMEQDGSLTFKSLSLNNTGKYKYHAFNNEGTQIGAGEEEIQVYGKSLSKVVPVVENHHVSVTAKAPKPTVTFDCDADMNATLTCDTGNRTDNLSWYKDDKIIQNEKTPQLFVTFTQIKENKSYSCGASNPFSNEQSENITVMCPDPEVFGSEFNSIVSILAGGGALLLLLSVFIICACRSCRQQKKHQQEEGELRLRDLSTKTDPNRVQHRVLVLP